MRIITINQRTSKFFYYIEDIAIFCFLVKHFIISVEFEASFIMRPRTKEFMEGEQFYSMKTDENHDKS